MLDPIISISQVAPILARWLENWVAKTQAKSADEQDAVRALWAAIDQTRIHLANVRDSGDPLAHRRPNSELVELWSTAAMKLRSADPDLSRRLRMKAEYWSDPTSWSEDDVLAAGIALDEIVPQGRVALQSAVPNPGAQNSSTDAIDVFISHASEDKAEVVRPLARELEKRGIKVWYDEMSLELGDSLRGRIDQGLRAARFGVVVLSPAFLNKRWPLLELDALLSLETSDGKKRILPIWHNVGLNEVAAHSPILAGRLAVSTKQGVKTAAAQIAQACGYETLADLRKDREHIMRVEAVGPDLADDLAAPDEDFINQFVQQVNAFLIDAQNPSGRESILLACPSAPTSKAMVDIERRFRSAGWTHVHLRWSPTGHCHLVLDR